MAAEGEIRNDSEKLSSTTPSGLTKMRPSRWRTLWAPSIAWLLATVGVFSGIASGLFFPGRTAPATGQLVLAISASVLSGILAFWQTRLQLIEGWERASARHVGLTPTTEAVTDGNAYNEGAEQAHESVAPSEGRGLERQENLVSWAIIAPFLEPNMVDRSDDLNTLISFIVDGAASPAETDVVAIIGPGGFGKTTLATQACHDDRITEFFPEILWVETGEECTPARLVQLISDLCVHLDGTRPALTDADQAGFHFARVLGDRRVLIVIDNVWSANDLTPFLLGGPNCVRLVTTRNARVCPSRTIQMRLGPMSPSEIHELLVRSVPALGRPDTVRLADLCGGWPLLATVVSSALGQDVAAGAPPDRAISEVGQALDELGPQAFDVWDSDQRKKAIGHAITSSLRSLEEHVMISGGSDLYDRYLSLAIFPAATPIPLSVLSSWWRKAFDWTPSAVRQFCRMLADRSLIDAYLADRDAILLHDVFRAYMRHLIGDDWSMLHRSLLDTHRTLAAGRWPELGLEHAYMWRHLPHHLRAGGLTDELADTLATPAYVLRKVAHFGHDSLAADSTAIHADERPESTRWRTAVTLVDSGFLLSGLTSNGDISATLLASLIRSEDAPDVVNELRDLCTQNGFDIRWATADAPDSTGEPGSGHIGAVTGVAVNANLVASCGEDGTVRLWERDTHRQIRVLRGHTGWVYATAISPDGEIIASAGDDGTIRLWRAGTGKPAGVLLAHTRRVRSLAFAYTSSLLVSGAEDGLVCLWDTEHARLVRTMETPGSPVWTVSVGCSDSVVAVGGEDEFIRLYDLDTGELVEEKAAHRDWIKTLSFAGQVPTLISGSGDGTARMWNVSDRRLSLVRAVEQATRVRCTGVSARADVMVVAGEDAVLRAFTSKGMVGQQAMPPGVDWIRALALTADGVTVAGCEDGGLRVWHSGDVLTTLSHGANTTWSTAFADGGNLVLLGRGDGIVEERDVRTAELRRTSSAGQGRIWSLSAGGGYAAAACGDGAVRVWSLHDDWALLLNETERRTWAVALNQAGTRVAASTADGTARVWEVPSGQMIWEHKAHEGRLRSMTFDAGGDLLLTGGGEGTARLWQMTGDQPIGEFAHPGSWIRTVAIDETGMRVAVGCGPGDIYVHDLTEQRDITTHLFGHSGRVLMVGFDTDTDMLVSAAADGTVRAWSQAGQKQLAEVRVDASLHCAAFDPRNRSVLTGSAAGSVAIRIPNPIESNEE